MHKVQQILNTFTANISPLSVGGQSVTIERQSPETVTLFPTLRVILGGSAMEADSFELDSNELTIYTDIFLRGSNLNIQDDALLLLSLIKQRITSATFGNDVISVRNTGFEEPTWNEQESGDYGLVMRVSWSIQYLEQSSY